MKLQAIVCDGQLLTVMHNEQKLFATCTEAHAQQSQQEIAVLRRLLGSCAPEPIKIQISCRGMNQLDGEITVGLQCMPQLQLVCGTSLT